MEKQYYKLVKSVQIIMGLIYLVNGVNWWFKMITPYPSLSDFAQNPPPPDMVGAMIQTGFMFHIVKASEILAGLALLSNRFVLLMLVAVFPVTVSVCLVDVILVASPRGYTMGLGSLVMNVFLMLSYFSYYRGLFIIQARPDNLISDTQMKAISFAPAAWQTSVVRTKYMPIFGIIALLFGVVMLSWVAIMLIQYIKNPLPLGGG